jgi:hypothetical protein
MRKRTIQAMQYTQITIEQMISPVQPVFPVYPTHNKQPPKDRK